MKPYTRTLLASTLLAGASVASADINLNIATVSDYLFRGVSQTSKAAMQGGLDYSNASGFYAGTWLSNVNFGGGQEVDLYTGLRGASKGIGYELGAIYYWYPDSGGDQTGIEADYSEVSLGLSAGPVSASVAYTIWGETSNAPFDSGDLYYKLSTDIPLSDGFSGNVFIGYYDFDNKTEGTGVNTATESYAHWGAALAKDVGQFGSVSVNYEQTDGDSNDGNTIAAADGPKIWIGWSKEF